MPVVENQYIIPYHNALRNGSDEEILKHKELFENRTQENKKIIESEAELFKQKLTDYDKQKLMLQARRDCYKANNWYILTKREIRDCYEKACRQKLDYYNALKKGLFKK